MTAATKTTPELLDRIRGLVAAGNGARAVAKEIGRSRSSVVGIVWRHHLGPWLTVRKAVGSTIPADFGEVYARSTQRDTAFHYGVCHTTVSKWATLRGIKRDRAPAAPVPAKGKSPFIKQAGPAHVRDRVQRDMSLAGQAADFLRRLSAVYRCNAVGAAMPKGEFWRRGNAVLTDAELIKRAEHGGWQPDEWRQVRTPTITVEARA